MIKWSDIKEEFEDLEGDFRARVVALFKRYEGMETDEVVRGKPVKVSQKSFAAHMGIPRQTFDRWAAQYGQPKPESEPATCINEGVPPAKGFVYEATQRVRECIPMLKHLSPETHIIIEEDLEDLEKAIAEVRSEIRKVNTA